ncbi:MAG: N-6 DNA methylase [Parcubacteria group bacterium]|nr:N-6 DNA methylase [Parcubacteria group bacterium]
MSTKPQELSKIIADLRQIIVGKVAMPTDQIEQITLFLFLKQLSRKHDDLVRIGSKELIFTGAWERYHFDVLMRHSGEELVKECREAVESLYKNPNIDATVRKVFERSYLKILEPKVLSHFLTFLNDKFSDGLDLGDFYESLLPILGTQNELGQFRTPRHIIDFIVKVIDPSIDEKIADPACGTAGFLVASYNYLKAKYTDDKGRSKLNPEQTKRLYNETIFGWDMEPLMVKFSLANLYLHGLKVPNVSENDTLLNENLWQHSFDIIVANPPFITPKGGARRHSRFAITSNKTEVLFCEWMVHHLNFNGRMGVIVPEGIIFDQSKGHQAIRKLFLDNGLWCVVSLPQKVFNPYSPVKTSIVFLDKTLKPDQILFYEVENHGFSLNSNPAPIETNDLPHALEIIKKYRQNLQNGKQSTLDDGKFYTISKQKILENSTVNLTGGIHKEKIVLRQEIHDIVELNEIINLDFGVRITKKNNTGSNYPVYGGGGESFRTDEFNRENDWVVSRFAMSANCVRYVSGKFFLLDSGFTFSIKDEYASKVSKKYIASVLLSIQNKIYAISRGGAQKNIDVKSFKAIKIPLPPIKVQEQVVVELENYQKIIDGALAVVENYKPTIKANKDSEIINFGNDEVVEIIDGDRGENYPPKSEFKTSGYCVFLNTKNVTQNGFVFDEIDFISKERDEKLRKGKLHKNDVVLTTRGTIGNSALNDKSVKYNQIRLNSGMVVLRPNIKRIDPSFLWNVVRSKSVQDQFLKIKSGSAQPQLPIRNLVTIEFPLPLLEAQKQIVAKIEEEQRIIEANKKMIEIMEQKISAVLSEV